MNCRRVEQLLADHLEGLVSPREARKISAHLSDCPACGRLRGEYRALRSELRELAGRLPLPDLPIERRSMERWIAEREPSALRRYRRFRIPRRSTLAARMPGRYALRGLPAPSVSVAAAVALVVAAVLLHGGSQRGVGRRESPGRVERPHSVGIGHGPALALRPPGDDRRARPTLTKRMPSGVGAGDAHGFTSAPPQAPTHRHAGAVMPQRMPLRQDDWDKLEARMRRTAPMGDDFVRIPLPRIASTSDQQMAAAVESYHREAAIVDPRLAHEVTIRQKAIALSDLCERLRSDTGIQLGAGSSVADEKVTLFCEKLPLREVMRQLSRPFGYAWLRSGKTGEYRYELVQDLRSQLLEEELRNRDRNEALLALDAEMERYRKYLGLSPDEALARSKTAAPEEKKLLERLAIEGWGSVQMYFRLSHNDLASLRAGQGITFSAQPKPGERPLPPEVAHGVLQGWRDWRVLARDDGLDLAEAKETTGGVAPASVPEVRASVTLYGINQRDPGQFAFRAESRIFSIGNRPRGFSIGWRNGPLAVGRSATALKPENAAANARSAHDPALRARVTVRPLVSCRPSPAVTASVGELPVARATSADALEALHRATGLPIVADYYTRLFRLSAVSVQNRPLYDALNQLADTMRMRWVKDPGGNWLQFRSSSYYDDRLKEVPNRLLEHWAASRRQHGALTLDDLVEIAQLPDAQLNGKEMAEGAQECFGLAEWDVARSGNLRAHLRYLAGFTPAQRQETLDGTGLPFTRMPLAQQQRFIGLALSPHEPPLQSLEDLAAATLRVDYTLPGGFEWRVPSGNRWVIPITPGREGTRAVRPPARGKTRETALQAARRIDPQADDSQIVPTALGCTILYIPGASNARDIRDVGLDHDLFCETW
jgi:hypothetical protein